MARAGAQEPGSRWRGRARALAVLIAASGLIAAGGVFLLARMRTKWPSPAWGAAAGQERLLGCDGDAELAGLHLSLVPGDGVHGARLLCANPTGEPVPGPEAGRAEGRQMDLRCPADLVPLGLCGRRDERIRALGLECGRPEGGTEREIAPEGDPVGRPFAEHCPPGERLRTVRAREDGALFAIGMGCGP